MPRRGARTSEDPPADSPTPCRSHRAWRTAPRPAQSDGATRRRTTILGSVTVEPRDPAQVRIEQGTDPAATERILRALPERFGLEQSLLDHVAAAKRLPGHLARPGDDVVGLLLVERHFPTAAEIHRMAVAPAHHRTGVGRRLVAAAEAELAADGVRLLQVKTRSVRPGPELPGHPRLLRGDGLRAAGGASRPLAGQPVPDPGEDPGAGVSQPATATTARACRRSPDAVPGACGGLVNGFRREGRTSAR